MGLSKTIWTNPSEYLRSVQPENPVLFFAPAALQSAARRFIDGFPGMVTYAVKSNPGEAVLKIWQRRAFADTMWHRRLRCI